jgi:hypothetical protein
VYQGFYEFLDEESVDESVEKESLPPPFRRRRRSSKKQKVLSFSLSLHDSRLPEDLRCPLGEVKRKADLVIP